MLKTLANIPHDKLLHFYYGSIVALISALLVGVVLSVVVVMDLCKEVYDNYNKGTVEVYDVVWTLFGRFT